MEMDYTEPRIVDYGSITEMTAGQSFHELADAVHVVGSELQHHSTGPCYPGYHIGPTGQCEL